MLHNTRIAFAAAIVLGCAPLATNALAAPPHGHSGGHMSGPAMHARGGHFGVRYGRGYGYGPVYGGCRGYYGSEYGCPGYGAPGVGGVINGIFGGYGGYGYGPY